REGERLLVDRLKTDEGKTFNPRVLLVGGNGKPDLAPSTTVTARVVGHVLGDKIRIGKYKKRTGYRKHTGFRASLTQIEIESIGAGGRKAAAAKPKADAKPEAAPKPAAEAPAEAHARTAHPPKGYEDMTVAEIAARAPAPASARTTRSSRRATALSRSARVANAALFPSSTAKPKAVPGTAFGGAWHL